MADKLSVILCTRNDKYCGNPMQRLSQTLEHAVSVLTPLSDETEKGYEIIVSDWGSNIPVSEVVKISEEVRDHTTFIHIPKEVTSKFDTPFSEAHALNCAARRATGEFIGKINQDILIGESFADWYYSDAPNPGFAYFCDRRDRRKGQTYSNYKDTPYDIGRGWRSKCLFWKTPGGMLLVPRGGWHEFRGYNEKHMWRGGIDREFIIRLTSKYGLKNLADETEVSYDFYHLWHHRGDIRTRKKNSRKHCIALDEYSKIKFVPNGEDWGLSAHTK